MLPDDDEEYWPALYRTLCDKIPYRTRKQARRDARRRVVPGTGHMRAYRCWHCPYWHVGHIPELVRLGYVTAAHFYRLAMEGNVPARGQRPVDMTEGIMKPEEVAAAFQVNPKTALEWARAFQANDPDVEHAQLAAFLTPGNQWRFSAKAVRIELEKIEYGTAGEHHGSQGHRAPGATQAA